MAKRSDGKVLAGGSFIRTDNQDGAHAHAVGKLELAGQLDRFRGATDVETRFP